MLANKTLLAIVAVIILAFVYEYLGQPISKESLVSCHASHSMIKVSGGTFILGEGALYPEEGPSRTVTVNDFHIDSHEVTNAQFRQFVTETGYTTVAEQTPSQSDYPTIPPELLKPGSAVFVPLEEAFVNGTFLNWWQFKEGAYWAAPNGKGSHIKGLDHYPVVHIAFADAQAYAEWKGHRLPTEEEFELISKLSMPQADGNRQPIVIDGHYRANTWQGVFPVTNNRADGFIGLAPVGCFTSDTGVYDLIGNVWEWTSSVYFPNNISRDSRSEDATMGYDPNQPGVAVRVLKGGSYLCAPDYCARYRPAARQAQDTGLGTSHIGFRTVKDI